MKVVTRKERSLADATEVLIRLLKDTADKRRGFLRLESPVEPTSLLGWLSVQRGECKTYWRSRDDDIEMAGLEAAEIIRGEGPDATTAAIETINDRLRQSDADLRYFGGARFSPTPRLIDSRWQPFGTAHFVLPLVELRRVADQHTLALNLIGPVTNETADHIIGLLSALNDVPDHQLSQAFQASSRIDIPDRIGWSDAIKECLRRVHRNELRKVVLARQSTFGCERRVNPFNLLETLSDHVGDQYRFLFQPAEGTSFIGVTPERLYLRDENRIVSEAVAGTRPRGANAADDERLGMHLLGSTKDRQEQSMVAHDIRDRLASLTETLQVGDTTLLKLPGLQHLQTQISATIKSGVDDGKLLSLLHPTPAVGGTPRNMAINLIGELEPFDRGWYAGPVGWIGRDSAEFAVGIRSALVTDRDVTVYAGAGIVAESDPDEEWNEIELKIGRFRAVLERA